MILRATAPDSPGIYTLQLTLVQESVAWFDQASGSMVRKKITIR
jgi:hypothetical protein